MTGALSNYTNNHSVFTAQPVPTSVFKAATPKHRSNMSQSTTTFSQVTRSNVTVHDDMAVPQAAEMLAIIQEQKTAENHRLK